MKLNENVLSENFFMTGKKLEDFYEILNDLDEVTSSIKVNSSSLSILSIIEENEQEKNKNDKLLLKVYRFLPEKDYLKNLRIMLECPQCFFPYSAIINGEKLLEKGDFTFLLAEARKNHFMIKHNEITNVMFTSDNCLSTLGMRIGMGELITEPSFQRDLLISQAFSKDIPMTLIARIYNGVTKIFSFMSDKYCHIPQNTIKDIIEDFKKTKEFGTIECLSWNVTNFLTSVIIELPDKAKELTELYGMSNTLVPGIQIMSSDTGDCSFTIRSTWRKGNSIFYQDEYKRKHIGEVDIKDITNEALKMFADFAIIPEKLCDLMLDDVIDLDNRTPAENEEVFKELIKSLFKQVNMLKAIGKKNEVTLTNLLIQETDFELPMTAYDVIMKLLDLSNRVQNLKDNRVEALSKVCGKLIFADFKVPISIKEKNITLSA